VDSNPEQACGANRQGGLRKRNEWQQSLDGSDAAQYCNLWRRNTDRTGAIRLVQAEIFQSM
jgi:hypothetical protein